MVDQSGRAFYESCHLIQQNQSSDRSSSSPSPLIHLSTHMTFFNRYGSTLEMGIDKKHHQLEKGRKVFF